MSSCASTDGYVINAEKTRTVTKLASIYLKNLEKKALQTVHGSIELEVLPVFGTEEEFIQDYLYKLRTERFGSFTSRSRNKFYIRYRCERHNKATGTSTGSPSKTRANSCKAYVSFTFQKGLNVDACIVRKQLQHNGHSPQSSIERRVNRIHPELVEHIEILGLSGRKPTEIVPLVEEWSKERGFVDQEDRQYYPSHKDIQRILSDFRKKTRRLASDELSVTSVGEYIEISTASECDVAGVEKTAELSMSQMVEELYNYSLNHEFEETPELIEAVSTAHKIVFSSYLDHQETKDYCKISPPHEVHENYIDA